MYEDDEKLVGNTRIRLSDKCKELIKKEKKRLLKEEGRSVSMQKIINNLILENYGEGNNKNGGG